MRYQVRRGFGIAQYLGPIYRARTNTTSVAQSFLVKIAVLGLNAATSILVARTLSASGRGEMSAIILWPGSVAWLTTLGLPTSLIVQLRKRPGHSSETISAAAWLVVLVGAISALIGFFSLPYWLDKYSPTDILFARCLLIASGLPLLLYLSRCSLEAAGDFLSSNLSLWAQPAITLVWLVVLVQAKRATPLQCGLAYIFGVLPSCAFLLYRVYKTYAPTARGSLRQIAPLLNFGLRAWGGDLLNALATSENMLVVHFLSPAEMGTYVVVASLARMLSVFQTSVITVLLPRVAAKDRTEVVTLTGFAFRLTTACAGASALVAGAMGPIALRFVYGSRYAESGATAFRILLAEVVLAGATSILVQAYLALDRPGTVTAIQATGIGLALLIMPRLIAHYGAAGAPMALLLSSAIRLVATLAGFPLLLKVPPVRIAITAADLSFLAQRMPRSQRA